jgi:hypothetical protein
MTQDEYNRYKEIPTAFQNIVAFNKGRSGKSWTEVMDTMEEKAAEVFNKGLDNG